MRKDDAFTTPATSGLELCRACQRPFVVPTSVLDIVDGDRCVVELHCVNCGHTRTGVHDDTALEALDQQLEASSAQIRNAVELFEILDEWERAERFIAALHLDHVVPEDF